MNPESSGVLCSAGGHSAWYAVHSSLQGLQRNFVGRQYRYQTQGHIAGRLPGRKLCILPLRLGQGG